MKQLSGKIVSVTALKNNTYTYIIENKSGELSKYIYFDNTANPKGLDISRYVTINYKIVDNERYGPSNIIVDIDYGDYITDKNLISGFLVNRVRLPKSFVDKLIEMYPNDVLDIVFKETEKLATLPYKNIDIILRLINCYKKNNLQADFCVELTKLGIPAKYHAKIIKGMGTDIENIKKSIYDLHLKCRIPFHMCDLIAQKCGYSQYDDCRSNAFITMMYKQVNSNGILYLSKREIEHTCSYYQIQSELIMPKLIQIDIDTETEKYYTSIKIFEKEKYIESVCNKLINKSPVTKIIFDEDWYIENTSLYPDQRLAVKNIFLNSINIVTGAPGTGKSHIIKCVTEKIYKGNKIYILAPTGAAVERLRSEDMNAEYDLEIRTLQSLIFYHEMSDKFGSADEKNDEVIIEEFGNQDEQQAMPKYLTISDLYDNYGEFIIFIDEMSMVDMKLFYKLMKVIEPVIDKIRLIFLGDKDQLPSIKGGCVLNDLILSKKISCTVLKFNHRSKAVGGKVNDIMMNAELALRGKDLRRDSKNVQIVNAKSKDDIKGHLISIIKKHNVRFQNSCIIIPTRRKGICIDLFNPVLQNIYNPGKGTDYFRVGDKIMHGKNNKRMDIYNGSILIIDKIDYGKKSPCRMLCKYYNKETDINDNDKNFRMIEYKVKNAEGKNDFDENKLDLAYAMTVHKAQGKGYDTVIIIVHSSMYAPMLYRKLLYTAITRSKFRCFIIADKKGLEECKKTMPERITNLYKNYESTQRATLYSDIMYISRNLGIYLKSKKYIKLFDTYHLNINSAPYNSSLTKLYTLLITNKNFYNAMMQLKNE